MERLITRLEQFCTSADTAGKSFVISSLYLALKNESHNDRSITKYLHAFMNHYDAPKSLTKDLIKNYKKLATYPGLASKYWRIPIEYTR